MNYTGVIIMESLADPAVIQDLTVIKTKVEPTTPKHQTPWLTQWTLHTFEVPEENAEAVAQKISQSIDQEHASSWFADFKNDRFHYIIFVNKVFQVDLANLAGYQDAKAYAISIGIPEHQIGFAPQE